MSGSLFDVVYVADDYSAITSNLKVPFTLL